MDNIPTPTSSSDRVRFFQASPLFWGFECYLAQTHINVNKKSIKNLKTILDHYQEDLKNALKNCNEPITSQYGRESKRLKKLKDSEILNLSKFVTSSGPSYYNIGNGTMNVAARDFNMSCQPSTSSTSSTDQQPSSQASTNARNKKRRVDDIDNENAAHEDRESQPQSSQKTSQISEYSKWIQDFTSMNERDQLLSFIDNSNNNSDNNNNNSKSNNTQEVDLTSIAIAEREGRVVSRTLNSLKFLFAVTQEEAWWLKKIKSCNSLAELVNLKVELFKTQNVPSGIEYIRTAVHHSIMMSGTGKYLKPNNEDWWRLHLYAQIFDNAFMFLKSYDIKRSECVSTAVKEYGILYTGIIDPPKAHKLDFSVRTVDGKEDIFAAEDKDPLATNKVVHETLEKNRYLRKTSLKVLEKKLPYSKLIEEFTPVTALWHGSSLLIHGTRKVGDTYFHFESCRATFPLLPNDFHGFARLLLVVLSLKRYVVQNHKVFQTIERSVADINLKKSSRSPMYLNQQDDSVELNENDINNIVEEMNREEEEEIKLIKEAISGLDYSNDEEEDILVTTNICEVFKNSEALEARYTPVYNCFETENKIIIEVDLPGVESDNVHLSLVPPSSIKISGIRTCQITGAKSTTSKGCPFGEFDLTVPLFTFVDWRNASIRLGMGILKVELPKEEGRVIPLAIT